MAHGHALSALAAVLAWPLAASPALAQTTIAEATLHRFSGNTAVDGAGPFNHIVRDAAGHVFGITNNDSGDFTSNVFMYTPPSGGAPASTVSIQQFPAFADALGGVTLGADHCLYGVTQFGGANSNGTVYQLCPPPAGQTAWSQTVLYTFGNYPAPYDPVPRPVFGANGVLYGTALAGPGGNGVIYALTPPAIPGGGWSYQTLYAFPADGKHGQSPYAPLLVGAEGALYGVTYQGGGTTHDGVVFKLVPPAAAGAAWTEQVLHAFSGPDGRNSSSGLISDGQGNLYGVTPVGGVYGQGVVYRLSRPQTNGAPWIEAVLYSFLGGDAGTYPDEELYRARSGNLYGITTYGGPGNGGTVYELSPPAAGQSAWTKAEYVFTGNQGRLPRSNLVPNGKGALIGSTMENSDDDASKGTLYGVRRQGP